MTDDQIVEAVATEVMGWHKEYTTQRRWHWVDSGGRWHLKEWNPLAHIADAWMVVEHVTAMLTPLPGHELQFPPATRFAFIWDVQNVWAMDAKEASRAICLAALRACGIEVT